MSSPVASARSPVVENANSVNAADNNQDSKQSNLISRTCNAVKSFFATIGSWLNYIFVAKGLNDAYSFASEAGVKGTFKHVVDSACSGTENIISQCSSQGVKDAYSWTAGKIQNAYNTVFSKQSDDQ